MTNTPDQGAYYMYPAGWQGSPTVEDPLESLMTSIDEAKYAGGLGHSGYEAVDFDDSGWTRDLSTQAARAVMHGAHVERPQA